MAMNLHSRISAALIAASLLLVASCASGDSDDVAAAARIDDSLGSLYGALTVKDDTLPHRATHSRFLKRMLDARANNSILTERAHLKSVMWHVADLRKYRATPEEYVVPLNTALHYVQQLYGGARAERFRRTGEPDVTAAEFNAAVAQLAALVNEKSATPRGMAFQAGNPAISKKELTEGCSTMGQISEGMGVTLASFVHTIEHVTIASNVVPVPGWLFAAATDVFWPSTCDDPMASISAQLEELTSQVAVQGYDNYLTEFTSLQGAGNVYKSALQNSSNGPYILSTLEDALKAFRVKKTTFKGASAEYSAAVALPVYAMYVTQYISLLQDYINNADAADVCGTNPAKWCDPSKDGSYRKINMCDWKKELVISTYDYDPQKPPAFPVTATLAECIDDVANPNGSFTIVENSNAYPPKLYVIETIKNSTGVVPAATESTSNPNLNQVTWNKRNAWTNATILSSQDQAEYWPWMNILVYPPMPDPNNPTALLPNALIPEVILTRELYSDIIGTIRDKEANDKAFSWISRPGVGPHGETDASSWLAYVKRAASKPSYGPPYQIVVYNGDPYCYLFATECTWPNQVYDMQVFYAAFGGSAATSTHLVQSGAGSTRPLNGFNISVGMPQLCDFDSEGKQWQSGGCTLDKGRGPMVSFKAQVLTDVDKHPLFGIPCIMVRFIDGRQNDAITGDNYGCDKGRNSQPGHFWSSVNISGDGPDTTEFSLPGNIISSITPYGINPADAYGADSLNAFIVGFRPYNAWGFSN